MESDLYSFLETSDQFDLGIPTYPPISENENDEATIKEDALFDELILNEFNEKKLGFDDSGSGNIHVPSTDRVQSLTNIAETTTILDMSFLQNIISLDAPDLFKSSQAVDLEKLPTHLVSPAITPEQIHSLQTPQSNDQYFTPLSSPALPPLFGSYSLDQAQSINNGGCKISTSSPISAISDSTRLLTQKIAQIEAQQQKLRDQMEMASSIRSNNASYRHSPLGHSQQQLKKEHVPPSPLLTGSMKLPTLLQRIALSSSSSPQYLHNNDIYLPTAPATPASLMNMNHTPNTNTSAANVATPANIANTSSFTQKRPSLDTMPLLPPSAIVEHQHIAKKRKLASSSHSMYTSSPRALKPLISPFLQPDPRYSNIAIQQQPIGLENRRSAHKVAEQKRRDTLKQSFDSLREEITDVLIQDSGKPEKDVRKEKEKEVKFMSKVLLLQHSYEYIVRLKTDSQMKDVKLTKMQLEIDRLRQLSASCISDSSSLSASYSNNNENQ